MKRLPLYADDIAIGAAVPGKKRLPDEIAEGLGRQGLLRGRVGRAAREGGNRGARRGRRPRSLEDEQGRGLEAVRHQRAAHGLAEITTAHYKAPAPKAGRTVE